MSDLPSGEAEPHPLDQLVGARFFDSLSREPDFEAPELQAYDAADLLLLRTAHDVIGHQAATLGSGELVVIGDRHGALTLGAAKLLGARDIRVFQDGVLAERALDSNAATQQLETAYQRQELGESLLSGAKLVLLQLPRSHAELDEIAWHVARDARPDVVLLAGGRDKHMSRGMNEVLGRRFTEVSAGLGWRKARVLTARVPLDSPTLGEAPFPVHARDTELAFDLYAFGATFGGTDFDHGSRLLLRTLEERPPSKTPRHIVDLGCGNGVIATAAALRWPEARVIASDQSAAAVAATRLTAESACVASRVEIHRADATESVPSGWADLVLLNPPFHTGSTVHAGVAHRLIRSTVATLAKGGELRLVYNSHLRYRELVEREIGPTRELARNRTFTVLAATRR